MRFAFLPAHLLLLTLCLTHALALFALRSTGNHRVLRFANAQQTSVLGPTGVLVLTPTVNSLGFNYPKGLVIDTEDNLLIADNGRNRIVVIPALGTGTAYALSPSSFASPSGITMDANGGETMFEC